MKLSGSKVLDYDSVIRLSLMVSASRSYVPRVTLTQHDCYSLRVTSKVLHLGMGIMPAQDDSLGSRLNTLS